MISDLLVHTDNKYRVIKNIWRTFAVLLEYCCKTDYVSLLADLEREHHEEQEGIENKYKDEINSLKDDKLKFTKALEKMKDNMQLVEK
jgi:hypothetical protein